VKLPGQNHLDVASQIHHGKRWVCRDALYHQYIHSRIVMGRHILWVVLEAQQTRGRGDQSQQQPKEGVGTGILVADNRNKDMAVAAGPCVAECHMRVTDAVMRMLRWAEMKL
jgi:hypothetical protein